MAQTDFTRNWNTVPVTGRYLEIDGDVPEGLIVFTPAPARMIDAAALSTVIKSSYYIQLGADGRFRVDLPATDDPDVTPIPFTYRVEEQFAGGGTFNIEVPLVYADSGIDISNAAQVDENPGLPTTITRAEFDALAMQVEMILGTVIGGTAASVYAGPGLDGGSVYGT